MKTIINSLRINGKGFIFIYFAQRGIAEVDEKAKLQDQDLITFSVILQGTAGRLWL
jgi:hypothetical protein